MRTNVYLLIFSAILLFIIFGWLHYLFVHHIVSTRRNSASTKELFKSNIKDMNTPDTNHTVDLPLNTKYNCSNMCGPLSRCAISGEQCTSDVDCYGCTPSVEGFTSDGNDNVPHANFGLNTWKKSADISLDLYKKFHHWEEINKDTYIPKYPSRESVTGDYSS